MIYELREYVAHDETVQQVHDRFADHTFGLFERHGIDVVGFWTDQQDPTRILYLVQFEDIAAQEKAWDGFRGDPEWAEVKARSEADGPIVAEMLSRTLAPVSYWPAASTNDEGARRS